MNESDLRPGRYDDPSDYEIPLGHDRSNENRLEIKLQEVYEELDQLADLMADSEDLRVCETPIVARLNAILDDRGKKP